VTGLSYCWEELSIAVCSMASRPGPLSERLRHAWMDGLINLTTSTAHQIPDPDLRERFEDLWDYFKRDPKQEKLIIETLSEDDQRLIAAELCELHTRVCLRYGAENAGQLGH
jgi:hypothetical protein